MPTITKTRFPGANGARATALPDNNPEHLYPSFAPALLRAIAEANAETVGKFEGLRRWQIWEGYRSQARQDILYAQGRTKPGAIVTNVRTSNHTRALAADVVWIDMDWRPHWDGPETLWQILGHCARANGLAWGGDWEMHDTPHIEPRALQLVTWRPLAALWLRRQPWK